jgi:uncharacterized protein YoxC
MCAALVLAAVFSGVCENSAEACWWHHHGRSCHRCQSAASSSNSSAASQNQGAQQFVSIDATSLLLKLLEKGISGQTTSTPDLDARFKEVNDKLDKLAGVVEQVQKNTEAIDALKVGQEAIANRVNNEFATKKEVGSLIEAAVKSQLGDIDAKIAGKIDERFNKLKEELNKDLDGREIKTAMNATGATHRLSQDLKPFTTSDAANNTQHADTWAKGKFLRVEGTATNGRLQVHPTYADAGTYWVSEDRLEKLSDLIK